MNLPREGRENYALEIGSDPELPGPWEASFNDGEYLEGIETEDGWWAWLVAGPDFDAAAVGMSPADTKVTINGETEVRVRNKANPVLTVRQAPRISLAC